MNQDDIKNIEEQTREAVYILKTISIKDIETLREEIRSIIYKSYATGKIEGNKEKFFA